MRVHLINPSHLAFGVAVITPRWLYVLAAATPPEYGDPVIVDETLVQLDPETIAPGDVVGIGIHSGNALRGYEVGRLARDRGAHRHLRRDPRHALSERGPRTGRRPRRRQRRRRPGLADRHQGLPREARRERLRRRPRRRRLAAQGAVGPAAARALHVGVGADRTRVSEALLVLLGVAHRRPEAARAIERRGDRRNRGAPAPRIPLHRPGGRQLLSGGDERPAPGRSPRRQDHAQQPEGDPRRTVRADGPAGQAAARHGVLHADHDGGRRGSAVSRRDAQGEHQGRARRRRVGDARGPEGHLQGLQLRRRRAGGRGCRRSASTASTSSGRSSSACRRTGRRRSRRPPRWRSART